MAGPADRLRRPRSVVPRRLSSLPRHRKVRSSGQGPQSPQHHCQLSVRGSAIQRHPVPPASALRPDRRRRGEKALIRAQSLLLQSRPSLATRPPLSRGAAALATATLAGQKPYVARQPRRRSPTVHLAAPRSPTQAAALASTTRSQRRSGSDNQTSSSPPPARAIRPARDQGGPWAASDPRSMPPRSERALPAPARSSPRDS